MRCGKWVVSESATTAELLEKCGPPRDQSKTTEDVWSKSVDGGMVKRGQTTIERWYYQPSSRALRMVVTIVDGKLKSIERAE